MHRGYIPLYRKMTENSLWLSEPFTRAQAWIDLLLLANHKEDFFFVRDVRITVSRGQVGWSQVALSKRWKWSRKKVQNFLKLLETEQQVEQQKTTVTTLITIKNYEHYNQKEQQEEQQKSSRRAAEEQHESTNNNDNNNKNILSGKPDGVIHFVLKDESFHGVTQEQVNRWMTVYPNINIVDQLQKAEAYFQKNPQRRKTDMDIRGHLETYLRKANESESVVAEIIAYLNAKAEKSYRHNTGTTRKLIKARISEGATMEDFRRAIDNQVARWKDDTEMNQYLRPSTLFQAQKFEGYVNNQEAKPKLPEYMRAY